jgi:hypothetical protein
LFMQCKEHILATIYPVTLETLDVWTPVRTAVLSL